MHEPAQRLMAEGWRSQSPASCHPDEHDRPPLFQLAHEGVPGTWEWLRLCGVPRPELYSSWWRASLATLTLTMWMLSASMGWCGGELRGDGSVASVCHLPMPLGHGRWALGTESPEPWRSLHECNLGAQIAPSGDIDSNGDTDHSDNSGESEMCGGMCAFANPSGMLIRGGHQG